ncbi:MAG TPA: universal stress protein [Candidatus Acidoferrum sp.]
MSSAASALDLDLKSVLLATDLSSASEKPLRHALAIARHYRAKLYITHVVSAAPYLMVGPEALEMGCQSALKDVQQLQRELRQNGSLDGIDHEFMLRRGVIWDELRGIVSQKQIGLVVLGTHGRRGFEKLVLGSLAEEVFQDAECPVLTVGPHSYREGRLEFANATRTYLFPTDFSEPSLCALSHAISFAKRSKARLILLHVVPVAPIAQATGWYSASEIMLMREDARVACVRRLEQLVPSDEQAQIEIQLLVQFGLPAEKVLQIALEKSVDLIILGLRRSALVGALAHRPWATAYEIVCGAACPVLTVRQ